MPGSRRRAADGGAAKRLGRLASSRGSPNGAVDEPVIIDVGARMSGTFSMSAFTPSFAFGHQIALATNSMVTQTHTNRRRPEYAGRTTTKSQEWDLREPQLLR